MDDRIEYYTRLLETAYGGAPWLVALDVLPATTPIVSWLRRLGASRALVISASDGVGEPPDPEFAPDPIVLGIEGADMMSSIRGALRAFANVPDVVQARVDGFDPGGDARVIGAFFDDGSPVARRAKYGAREHAWQVLEDKTVVDALWDAAGVPRAPSLVARLDDAEALRDASAELDVGAGTVWAADMREGFHGGASFVRRVRTPEELRVVREHFAPHADKVRIMPYLEGIPCSIHGIVLPDYVVALRPCEMIVFGRPDGTFQYGQVSTFWDPPAADRRAMRQLAKDVGVHLRDTLGYRGAFTIDGVLTADGFFPTELNPRFGAALNTQGRSVDLPLMLLNFAIVEGEPFDWRGADLEDLLLTAADRARSGRAMAVVSASVAEQSDEISLVFEESGAREVGSEEAADATVVVGPNAAGGVVLVRFSDDRTPIGESLAPRAAAALRWADERWSLGIGPLSPPQSVR